MATTTNYSWTTPDDTDLVKDGAAAIRTLGTAIDTTVFTNAGAAVAKATVDAKGDLIAGTADNTIARLAVGANGTTLVADSGEATGLAWKVDPVADLVTTAGDTLYATAADTLARLGIGTAGQLLRVNSGATAPEWATPASPSPASASSYIATGDGSNSTSYTGAVTAQSVTLTTGTKVMIVMTARCETDSVTGRGLFMGYAISGATTVAASDGKAIVWLNRVASSTNVYATGSAVFFETVTAGSNTFTLQVRVNAGSSYFQDRQLLVIDLGS
jgi:hypothetical protein